MRNGVEATFIGVIMHKKPEKITKWMNIYSNDTYIGYESKYIAGKFPLGRIACIQVTYEEGEGL
jgi:hypothetical protein